MSIRTVLAALAVALVSVPVCGQDLLAHQAPVDRRLKALDSVRLHRYLPNARKSNTYVRTSGNPSANLYPDWNNETGRSYGVNLPAEYKIDLRHFCMPCESRLVTSHYGWRSQFGRNHYGTDIKLYVGDTVRAAFSGKVRVVDYEGRGYGNYVIIRHENGLETVYGHMSKHLVQEDQYVRAGQPIGLGGNTGRSTGSHLHFETRLLGEYINPELLFNFEAQDAKGDYYVWRANGGSQLQGTAHHAVAPVPMAVDYSGQTNVMLTSNDIAPLKKNGALDNSLDNEQAQADKAAAKEAKRKAKEEARKKKEAEKKRVHTVKEGDTLSGIAVKYHTTVAKLCKTNHISETSTLRLGQILKCS